MALKHWVDAALTNLKQYKYVLLIVLIGLIFLLIPESQNEQAVRISEEPGNILTVEQQLSSILSNVKGAGEVLVFLSQASGEEILYQTDEEIRISADTNESQITTVTVSGSDRGEEGLIRQVNPPVYLVFKNSRYGHIIYNLFSYYNRFLIFSCHKVIIISIFK